MAKIELKLKDAMILLSELQGVVNSETNNVIFKGFINQNIPLKEKYWLNKLLNSLLKERELIEKLRNEMIEKLGEKNEETGSISIPNFIEKENGLKEINPNLLEFQKNYDELLEEIKSFEYKPIDMSLLDTICTEDTYNILFKLVSE